MRELSSKIVHLSTLDSGGAGKAALRLNLALRGIGADSAMVVALKQSRHPSVSVLDPGGSGTLRANNLDYNGELSAMTHHWGMLAANHPNRKPGLEMFSDTKGFYAPERAEQVGDAAIVNLHWVTGLFDYPRAVRVLKGKKIVWTLHDMNAFTGGCHYAGSCDRYRFNCGACPQLGSSGEDDLSRRVWEQKMAAYRELDITVVTPSRWMAACASASSLFRERQISVIPYGIPLDVFRPKSRAALRTGLDLPEKAKVILFGADSLTSSRKGFVHLLEALQNHQPKEAGRPLYLAVFGHSAPDLKIPTRFPILNFGSIANESDLASLYALADVFVLPSLEDNLPNTVIEALACGTPVVGFDTGGVCDMVRHKHNGFLAPPMDVASLAEGIDWCLFDCDRDEMARTCREWALERHSLDAQGAAYLSLYGVGDASTAARPVKPAKGAGRALPAKQEAAICVATSIAPGNPEKQQAAVATWLDLGMRVLSLNNPDEIDQLKPHFPRVDFFPAGRNALETTGRALVYFDDILELLGRTGSEVCGIINADIHLRADRGFTDFVVKEARGSLVYGSRIDVASAAESCGASYDNGFDFFFFDRALTGLYRPTPFALGATWWDYWAVIVPLLRRYPVKKLESPVAFHPLHHAAWSQEEWQQLGDLFWGYLREMNLTFAAEDCVGAALKCLDQIDRSSCKLWYPPEAMPAAREHEGYLVSAIVSTYNAERFFQGCLQNLFAQTLYRKGLLEIVIINSGSGQGEDAIAAAYLESHEHIVYQRTERETLYAAWNRGIRLARGKYLTHANTDDRHRCDAFETMARALDEHDVGLVYVDALMTQGENETFEANSAGKKWLLPDFNLRQALIDCPFGCQVMWRASAHAEVGLFDPGYKRAGDYEFFLRLALRRGALHLPEILVLYHESMSNLSYEAPDEVIQEVQRFIAAQRREIPLQEIYPYLLQNASAAACLAALVDFGNHLMGASATLFTDLPLAEALYRRALELAPGHPDLLCNLAAALIAQGKSGEALTILTTANAETPRLKQYLDRLGQGEMPQLALTQIGHPGLDAMPPVKLPQEIRVPRQEEEIRAFAPPAPAAGAPASPPETRDFPTVVIDGVFFMGNRTGIARLWIALLSEWAETPFGRSLVLLDRIGTAPKIKGVRYRRIPAYDYNPRGWDSAMLQQVCDEEGADLFVSTYYTTPLTTPSLFVAYDMIPEFTTYYNLAEPQWQEKHHAICQASAFVAISRSTASDLVKLYPELEGSVTIAHCGIDSRFFSPASAGEILRLREQYGIAKPYFLFVGGRNGYKNGRLALEGFVRLPDKERYTLLYVGGYPELEPYLLEIAGNADVRVANLSDEQLRVAYSDALAFIYPSRYEGFGLPILEAMGCGCPVITCRNSSLPEVAGEAALYVDPDDPEQLADAMRRLLAPELRREMIRLGSEQARKFSWGKMARIVREVICSRFAATDEGAGKLRDQPSSSAAPPC